MAKDALQKHGTVQSFNVSPKGAYEGLLFKTGGELIQINFPQELSAEIADLAGQGKEIQVEIEPAEMHGRACHPVYRLVGIAGSEKGRLSSRADGHQRQQFSGQIERLNYALHGEVNGAILNTGDFLHVKPHGAAVLELKIGMQVKGTGSTKPMFGGHQVIEAHEVNEISIEKKPKKKAHE
ncbi:MAG: hypothetical protein M3Y72_03915 [Acidobacteriota bacterium]|nr:hypothetical protein [Acidobacteriota bacterium]